MKNNFRIPVAIVATSLIISSFYSCKSGPDDPFISLRTRNSRVKGVWNLKSLALTKTTVTTDSDAGSTETTTQTETESYDGTTFKESDFTSSTNTNKNKAKSSVGPATLKLTINDDYTIKSELSTTSASECDTSLSTCTPVALATPRTTKLSETGKWWWGNANDDKIFIYSDVIGLGGSLKRLANSEMVIENVWNEDWSEAKTGSTKTKKVTGTETWTYAKE